MIKSHFASLLIVSLLIGPSVHAADIWLEDFPDQEGKGHYGSSALSPSIVTNMGGITNWSVYGATDLDGDASLNWWMVTNGVFEGQDVGSTYGYWESEDIAVTNEDQVEIHMTFHQREGGLSGSENSFSVYYRLNGGTDQQALAITIANQSAYDGMAWTSSAIDVSSSTTLNVKVKIKATWENDGWAFDDVAVAPYVAPSNIPPVITLAPSATSVIVSIGTPYEITASAAEPDGDTVYLGASNMPPNAVFSPNPTNGEGAVTNVFTWIPTSIGTTNVTFYTSDDADGSGTPVTVTFTVMNASSILITEIMQNPTAAGDVQGEWFEICNRSRKAIDINGWTLKDDGSNSHVIDNGQALIVPPWEFLVLGRNADIATNGNVVLDYEYTSFQLDNLADEIVLLNASSQGMARVNYDSNFPIPAGESMYLKDPNLDQNTGTNWATSSTPWPESAGDFGSPGEPNEEGDWSPVIPGAVMIIQ